MSSHPGPLSLRPLYEEVANRLRQRILEQQLEPGHWIDELRLCKELGISRTPLREALKVLATEGLVTMRPRRGAYVTETNPQDVRAAYELLALLESDAAALVASRANPEHLAELKRLHGDLERHVGDPELFFRANERFHLRLLELEGNRLRLQFATELRQLMKLNRHHSLLRRGRIEDSLSEHRALLEALLSGDAARCRNIAQAHFLEGLRAAIPDETTR